MEIREVISMAAITHGKGSIYVIAPSTYVPVSVAV